MAKTHAAASFIETAWVAPPEQAGGQDHLAVRAVGEAIYAELVPGITNVTDRLRSYAFYTWFTWWFQQNTRDHGADNFTLLFRRAECLYTLVAAQHGADVTGSDADPDHGAALPGREKLMGPLRTLGDGELRLSAFAAPDLKAPNRYFAPDLGGLRQYYLGSLQQLDVMGGNLRDGILVTAARGVRLATTFNSTVDGHLFWKTVQDDVVNKARLRHLKAVCPCGLREHAHEQEVLLDFLLRRDGHTTAPSAADTVMLVLQYLSASPPLDDARGVVVGFRNASYGGVLPDGAAWRHDRLTTWAAYQRHELLSVALQALFSLVLDELQQAPSLLSLRSAAEVAAWIVERLSPRLSASWRSTTVEAFFATTAEGLVPVDAIHDAAHETVTADSMLGDEDAATVASRALELIAQLVARMSETDPYGGFKRERQYFSFYPLNLYSLRRAASADWQHLTMLEWLEWLVRHWSVGTHLRVALRKLRNEGVDTFRIKPTDDGLVFIDSAPPTWSNPRLFQVLRALRDLGLVDANHQLLAGGHKLLKELHGH